MVQVVPKVTSIADDELKPLSPFQEFVVFEFTSYKELSLTLSKGNFVTPNEVYQETNVSLHSLFGRDKVFTDPTKWKVDIDYENLTHIHFDKDQVWSDSCPQWYCTSQYSLVYSAFLIEDNHYHFVIHDLLLNENSKSDFDAHDSYTEDDIRYYIDNAEYHRKRIKK